MIRWFWRATLLACGALAAALFLTALHAREGVRSTTAGAIRVSFSVMPAAAFDPEHRPRSAPAEADAAPHRIVVQLTERDSGRHVSEAQVDLIITSGEYASGPPESGVVTPCIGSHGVVLETS